jgi:NitT/TauT family transport system permease protein
MQATIRAPRSTWASNPVVRVLTSPIAARLTAPLLIIVAWQIAAPIIGSSLLPMPLEVVEEIGVLAVEGTIWSAFATSLTRLAIGLVFAFVVGAPLGLLIGLSPRAEAFAHDLIVVGLTFPYLIWGILVSMWFGFGDVGPILVVFIAALPYFMVNISEGVRDVSRELLDMARSYGVPRSRLLRHLVLPSLSPFLFAALRYGLANGWKGLVLAEVFAATSGAGWEIAGMRDIGNAAGLVAYALYFATFSILVERLVFGRLSAWVFRWRPPQPGAARATAP